MILVDERIRDVEFEYLQTFNHDVKKIPLSKDVYDEISGHSDVFYANIDGKVYSAPNALIIENGFVIGKEKVGKNYPDDVKYNVCQIGKYVIGSKYADEKIKDKINIFVNQGYTKCSIAVTGKKSCITTDKGIYDKIKNDIDTLYIEEKNIKLLDKNKNISKMNGFIGGASALINNTFILFGDIKKFENENQKKILNHLSKHDLKFKDFKNLEVIDYGGILMYN